MSTTATEVKPDFTKDVIVRIYEVVTNPDPENRCHKFTVSISLTWDDSQAHDRESAFCLSQVWHRAKVVADRDKIVATPDQVHFIREKLIHSTQARPVRPVKDES